MRDLSWSSVTRSSRLMLPVHAAFPAGLGVIWLIQPAPAAGSALNSLAAVWPVANSAVVLLVVAALQLVALVLGSRGLEAFALIAGALAFAGLGVAFQVGHMPATSYSAPLWPFYVACAHVASLLTVLFRETPEIARD